MTNFPRFVHLLGLASAAVLVLCLGCGGAELRGKSVPSQDGNTYLSIDDDNGGACGPIKVDGLVWPYPLHIAAPIGDGPHKIQCGEGGAIEFEIKHAHTFHFNYWGP